VQCAWRGCVAWYLYEELHQLLDLRRDLGPHVFVQLSQPVDAPAADRTWFLSARPSDQKMLGLFSRLAWVMLEWHACCYFHSKTALLWAQHTGNHRCRPQCCPCWSSITSRCFTIHIRFTCVRLGLVMLAERAARDRNSIGMPSVAERSSPALAVVEDLEDVTDDKTAHVALNALA
jgi:hypothetical protein